MRFGYSEGEMASPAIDLAVFVPAAPQFGFSDGLGGVVCNCSLQCFFPTHFGSSEGCSEGWGGVV